MFKCFKFLHFVGLTLFLGSIWVFIVQGTPMQSLAITTFVRVTLIKFIHTLTIPGLFLMIISGIGMFITRSALLRTTFFKIKLIIPAIILFNAMHISQIANRISILVQQLPATKNEFHALVMRESILGAVNVVLSLFLIGYSLAAKKYQAKKI